MSQSRVLWSIHLLVLSLVMGPALGALVHPSASRARTSVPATRDVDTIVANLEKVADDYNKFYSAITIFDGQPEKLVNMSRCQQDVERGLIAAIASTQKSNPLDLEDSAKVMTALARPYPTFMEEFLGEIAEKKPQFDVVNRTEKVAKDITYLQSLSTMLSLALEAKVDDQNAREIKSGRDWVNQLFATTLSQLKGTQKSGGVGL